MEKFMDESIMAKLYEEAGDENDTDVKEQGPDPESLVMQPLVKIGDEWVPFEDRVLLEGKIRSCARPEPFMRCPRKLQS
ncbi:hypothetical protein [Paenibacillus hexagrammi]|uniref:Uncharacterized protein n=1 Tax=Paenibacillus hexagrammi TaxID=2908839 RepID=A0ABY3SDZ8_9BACL|nr:hypothetical protein [Paenibacillus sp. YPD9-1]UJF32213.1 hypothetical protein L0M14_21180 [Paenibacillus sp. YPD9-1]